MKPASREGNEDIVQVRSRAAAWLGRSGEDPSPTSELRELLDLAASVFSRDPQAPAIGDRVGRFTLVAVIGSGGMGLVYKAKDEETDEVVALKVVPRSDPRRATALANEARLLPRARHPNVVALVDSGVDGDWAWIALALVEGPTLDEIVPGNRAPRPPLRTMIAWFRDLARALAALHDVGLLHRDVKPSNVVVDPRGRPVLIDFGLATEIERGQVEAWLAGTIPYMSPEQTQAGFSALTARSDIYSLAITFHEALTGTSPPAVRRSDALQSVAFDPVPRPSRVNPGLPPSLDPIFARALAKHPRERYANAEQLAEDLDLWLQDRPLQHADEAPRTRMLRFGRRHPSTTALLVLLVLVPLAAWIRWEFRAAAEHRDARAEVEHLLEQGKLDEAADKGLILHRKHPNDAADFAVYRLAVEQAAPVQARRMIQSMTFCPAWAFQRSDHSRAMAVAAQHFAHYRHPQLLFQIALGRFLAGTPADALAVLQQNADLAAGSQLIQELHALMLLETGNLAELADAATALAAEPPENDTVTCFRAYRLAREHGIGNGETGRLVPAAAIEQARHDLDAIVDHKAHFVLARTMRAFLALELRDTTTALADLAELDLQTAGLDRAAVLTWRARVEAEHPRQPGTDDWREAWDRVESYLDRAARTDLQFVTWFAESVSFAGDHEQEQRVECMMRLFGHAWPGVPELGLVAWNKLARTVEHLGNSNRNSELIELMRRVERQGIQPYGPDQQRQFDLARKFMLWALVEQGPKQVDAPADDPEERSRLAEVLRYAAGLREGGALDWDDEVAGALALARLGVIGSTAEKASDVRPRAITALDHLLDAGNVSLERKRRSIRGNPLWTDDQKEKSLDVLENLKLPCKKAREILIGLETRRK